MLSNGFFISCCVDEVTGERFNVDAIVHYGRACLSASVGRVPIRYVFGQPPCPIADSLTLLVDDLLLKLSKTAPSQSTLVITYDFRYRLFASHLCSMLTAPQPSVDGGERVNAKHILWSEPLIQAPNTAAEPIPLDFSTSTTPLFTRCGRSFHRIESSGPVATPSQPWSLVHVGDARVSSSASTGDDDDESCLQVYRILLGLTEVSPAQAFIASPSSSAVTGVETALRVFVKRRSYLINRARQSKLVGILVSWLCLHRGFVNSYHPIHADIYRYHPSNSH